MFSRNFLKFGVRCDLLKFLSLVLLVIFCLCTGVVNGERAALNRATTSESDDREGDEGVSNRSVEGVSVVGLNYELVKEPLIFTIVICLAGLSKIGYHHSHFLSSKIPEACILIILGTIAGAILRFSGVSASLPQFFKPHEFFIFLLPPIILEASFSLHDRTFGNNIGSVLLFTVVGTVLAAAFVGLSLFGLAQVGAMGSITDIGIVEMMVFASLIVAVDAVAVLAVFNEIGVNKVLYFLVLGESLLNDGVTIVLYQVFQAFSAMDEIKDVHIVVGVVKFLVVCLGGLLVGVLTGMATALLTKASEKVEVVQPILIFAMAYLGFLLAELFGVSGVISIIGCGLTQRQYAFHNISNSSSTTVKYFITVISSTCEVVIFLFLGMAVVNDLHDLHLGFTLWTLALCLFYRFLIIFGITFLINWLDPGRLRKIGFQEQFIIAYGGLRGAVCFSLVALLDPDEFPRKDMFVSTTLVLILFTAFIQGITLKPLVFLMKIKLAPEKGASLYMEFQDTVTHHMMTGVEDIVGSHGRNRVKDKLMGLHTGYLMPWLTKPASKSSQRQELYEHLILKEHTRYLKLSGAKPVPSRPKLPHVASDIIMSTATSLQMVLSSQVGTQFLQETILSHAPLFRKRPEVSTPQPETHSDDTVIGQSTKVKDVSEGDNAADDDVINAQRLRHLLLRPDNHPVSLSSSVGRNLHEDDDLCTEIQRKSHKNHRLQQMVSMDGINSSSNSNSSDNNRKDPPRRRDKPTLRSRSAGDVLWRTTMSSIMTSIPPPPTTTVSHDAPSSNEIESSQTSILPPPPTTVSHDTTSSNGFESSQTSIRGERRSQFERLVFRL